MIASTRRATLVALTALALAVPAAARAESPVPGTRADTTAPAVVDAGPTVAAAAVAVQARTTATADAAAVQSRAGLGQSRALMLVGLATFIAGAVIGNDAGTIIMIAGAGIGLYGLYQYLQ